MQPKTLVVKLTHPCLITSFKTSLEIGSIGSTSSSSSDSLDPSSIWFGSYSHLDNEDYLAFSEFLTLFQARSGMMLSGRDGSI